MNEKIVIALKNIGLKESEIKVYLAILSLGYGTATEIAKKARIYEKNAYDALKRLCEFGLVSRSVRDGKNFFHVEDVGRLISFWESKKELLESVIPRLVEISRTGVEKKNFVFYVGRGPIKAVFEDVLKGKEVFEVVSDEFYKNLQIFYHKFQSVKRERGIFSRALLSGKEKEFFKEFYGKYKKHDFPTLINFFIYEDKLAIILWTKDPIGMIVKDKNLSEEVLKFFEERFKCVKK